MAPFLDLSRLSFEIWKATRHLLDVRLALFLAPSLTLQVSLDNVPTNLRAERGRAKSFIRYTKIPEMA